MRINLKLILIFFEITLTPLLILGFVAYSSAREEITSQTISKLAAIADLQKSRFETANKENLEKLILFTHDPDLLQEVNTYNTTLNIESLGIVQNILSDKIKKLPSLREMSIANLDGDIISSTNPQAIGLNLSGYIYFQEGKNTNSVTHFSKGKNGQLSLSIAGPLILDNKTIGVLIINSDASNITGIVFSYIGLGQTGETLLVTKDVNGDVLFLTPTRFDSNAGLTRIVAKDKTKIPSTHAVNGEEKNMLDAVDYHNTPVIAVTRYIPEAGWGIVAKISQKEAYGSIERLGNLFIFMVIVSAAFIILISFSVAKSLSDPIKSLAKFADEIAHKNFGTTTTTNIDSKDEIGVLARSFNIMSTKLKEYYGELEQKVKERTQRLQKTEGAMINVVEDLEKASRDLEKFKLALDNVSDNIIITDPEGIVIYANQAVEKTTGYKSAEAVGKKSGALWKTSMPQEFYQKMWDTIKKQKRVFIGEIQNRRKNGTVYTAAISISPVINRNGEVEFFVSVERDITKEKDIDKAKTEFVSLASHQLRTPLTSINWYIEMLETGDVGVLNDKQKEFLAEVYKGSRRMVQLVDDLLNISRLETGRLKIEPVLTDLKAFISEVRKDIKSLDQEGKCEVRVELPQNKLRAVNIDRVLLRQVITNLLTNAIHYSSVEKKGHVVVSLVTDPTGYTISVKDDGIGIPKEAQSRLFEKFFRADNARTALTDGTGLGLYFSKQIMESSGGTIGFSSASGQGTTFYVTIPLSGMKSREGEKRLE